VVILRYRNGLRAELQAGGRRQFIPAGKAADKTDMADSPGHHIDIVSSADGVHEAAPVASTGGRVADESSAGPDAPANSPGPRRLWVGIQFECCGVYKRVYRDPDVPLYEGQCPQCGRKITMRVGPDGVNSRIFKATPI
jgi:hypothetical protein